MSVVSYRGTITASEPHKALTSGRKRHVGRDNAGRISTRHKGGGHKRLWRDVDFSYEKKIPAKVETVEYDPNRSGFIGLLLYTDGSRRYALLPQSVKAGDTLVSSESAPATPGNRMPLRSAPIGAFVYNVELKPNGGAKLGRAAGTHIEVVARDQGYVDLKMPSTEIRKVLETCWATVGEVSNPENKLVTIGKAGRSRWLGIRPTVRGSAAAERSRCGASLPVRDRNPANRRSILITLSSRAGRWVNASLNSKRRTAAEAAV